MDEIYLYDVDPLDYESEVDFHMSKYGRDEIINEQSKEEVQEIFNKMRSMPFRNKMQRREMVGFIQQLEMFDTGEVRVFFKELGRLLNDLADNGKIDGSYTDEIEDEMGGYGYGGSDNQEIENEFDLEEFVRKPYKRIFKD